MAALLSNGWRGTETQILAVAPLVTFSSSNVNSSITGSVNCIPSFVVTGRRSTTPFPDPPPLLLIGARVVVVLTWDNCSPRSGRGSDRSDSLTRDDVRLCDAGGSVGPCPADYPIPCGVSSPSRILCPPSTGPGAAAAAYPRSSIRCERA